MTTVQQTAPAQVADPRRWKALAVVLIASFMILLDISIVNVAIPSIQRDLGTTFAEIQWVLAGYQLGYAVVLITGGRLGDIFGRKRLFIIGVTGFTVASAICGLAPNSVALITARVAQGLMAALMYPQVLSVIQVSFPPRERGTAFGIFGGVIGVASISGPLLGGLLIQADLHIGGTALLWRPIFLVNLPIGIGAVIAASIYLRESRAPDAPRLDIPGTLLATVGLFLIAYPLVEGRDAGWPPWAYLMLAGGFVVLVIFGRYIRARAARGGSPLVEPKLFGDRAFVVGSAIAMVLLAGVPAFFLTFSLYMQIGLGFSALRAGLTTLPFALVSALASGVSIRLAPKLGKRILSVGCVLLIAGMAGLWLTVKAAGTGISSYEMIPALAVCGAGLGFVIAPLINIILAGIVAGSAGSASGVLTTVQQIGGALGVAIIGIIFFGQVERLRARGRAERRVARVGPAHRRRRPAAAGRRHGADVQPLLHRPVVELRSLGDTSGMSDADELVRRLTTRRRADHRPDRAAGGRGGLRPRVPRRPLFRDGRLRPGVPHGVRAAQAEEPVRSTARRLGHAGRVTRSPDRLGAGVVLSLALELGPVQLGIEAAGGEEGAVRAPLDDAAGVDDQDDVGLAHRRQAVRDHQRGAARQRTPERLLHRRLGLRVEVRGGLVEHDDVRRLEQETGQRDALLLAAGEAIAAVADERVETVRKGLDQWQDLGVAERLEQLGVGGVGLGVEQVRADRLVEEMRVLGDHAR